MTYENLKSTQLWFGLRHKEDYMKIHPLNASLPKFSSKIFVGGVADEERPMTTRNLKELSFLHQV